MASLAGFDAMLLPTAPTHPSIAAVQAYPIGVNSLLGTYTNFVNLLDLAAVAIPAGAADGGRFGVSLIVRAFDDQVAIDIAAKLTEENHAVQPYPTGGVSLVVFGAHLTGQPFNHQLVDAGARLIGPVTTSPSYRMYALPGPIPKPGVVRTPAGTGASLLGKLWQVPPGGLGEFLADLPTPMTLGKVELSDGRWVVGFSSMYWTPAQMLAHMTVNGASVRTGDFYASGTVSGPEKEQRGSLMELSWGGKEPFTLPDGTSRTFLEDGDEVTITATAPGAGGALIGFGEVAGRILPVG